MTKPSLGEFQDGPLARLDLSKLLETRMLIQANSGGGKSWAIRRLLEQTAGHVQQLVIDPEGEFATLREKYDYVIAAPHDGDALAHPRTAQLLARRLLETGVSAILDIYDLKAHERQAFVKIFLETIVNAPKTLWQSCLIVLDEAHVFCPEKGESAAAGAVIDLATRGRKRGFSLIAATQRLAKLNKDCAAELLNKLIGRTGLDVDVKRAAEEIGMTSREAMEQLRPLPAGEFYAFGPALSLTVRRLKVGPVQTTHPKAGDRALRAPPKPTEAIKAVLPKLADLPKEAEAEARSIEDLKRELTTARRDLTLARKEQPAGVKQDPVEQRRDAATVKRLTAFVEELMKFVVTINTKDFAATVGDPLDAAALQNAIEAAVGQARKLMERSMEVRNREILVIQKQASQLVTRAKKLLEQQDVAIDVEVKRNEPFTVSPRPSAPRVPSDSTVSMPQQKLLDKLLWLEDHSLYPAPKATLAAIAGVSSTSGGYFTNLGSLRSAGLIDYPSPGEVAFTDAGRAMANQGDDPRAAHEHWLDVVTPPQRVILQALIDLHPEAIGKDELAVQIGVSPTSGGYFNNLGRLRTIGAIDYPQKGRVAVTRYVMPSQI